MEWSRIDAQREEAARLLHAVEAEFGRGGALFGLCQAVWSRALQDARVSILHGDRENAEHLLDRALHVLARAPELARRAELRMEDLEALLLAS